MKQSTAAFTLLELVVALAIVATLAGFAVPVWHRQMARGYRLDASAALYRAAQYVDLRRADGSTGLPPGFDRVPASGRPVYRLNLLPADDGAGGYVLEASPLSSGPMHDDACGVFILNGVGERANRFAGGGTTLEVDECWNSR